MAALPGDEPPDLEGCRALLAEQPGGRETARCFYRLATSDAAPSDAVTTLEGFAADGARFPWFAFYLGHLRWPATERAATLYGRAAEGFGREGSLEGEILSRINRSQLLARLGRRAEVRAEVHRIFELTEETEDAELRAWGQITLARDLVERGEDLERAHDLLRALEIPAGATNGLSLRKDRLILLGQASVQMGRFGAARRAFRGVVELAGTIGDPYLEANGRYNLAWVAYEELRETPSPAKRSETAALAREAMDVASAGRHASVEVLAAWMLGVLTPGDEGVEHLERCYRRAESPDVRSHCLNALAVKLAPGDPAGARRLLAESRELARESRDGFAEVRTWQARMRVDWATRPPERALASSREALEAIETLRDRQPEGSPVQAGLFSVWSDEYAWLAGRLLEEAGRGLEQERAIREAFRVSERMRARALLSWLRRTEGGDAGGESPEFVDLDEVRRALGPDEALLSFQVAPWEDVAGDFGGGSWLLAVTRDGVTVHRLPDRIAIRRSVELFEGLILRRDGSEAGPGTHLYRKLLAPTLEGLPPSVERLVVVPDDALHTLAFAALRPGPEAEPLGHRYELVRAPSATFWLRWLESGSAREGGPREHPVLVLADPELPAREEEGGTGAGPVQVATMRGEGGPVAGRRGLGVGLGRLPHARREGRAAVRALGGGVLLSGPDASESALRGFDLRGVGLLHFAAHAVSDEDRPERSAILLAAGGGPHDGLLQSAEIADLDLAGSAVVLASCRSASGTVLRGEGVMSLGRAFFQAGAHSVVASLWPLRDDESAVQLRRVYRHLARGATVAGALHAARREAVERGEPAAAWAGLVLLGNGDVAPAPEAKASGGPSPWVVAAAGVLLAALVILAFRLRRRLAGRRP